MYEYVFQKTENEKKNKQFTLKTVRGEKINTKLYSIRRNKNITLHNQLLNSFVKKGKKLNLLKHYNMFLETFFYLLITNENIYKNYQNSDYIFDLLKTKFYYYKFENLLIDPIEDLKCLFDLKAKKPERKKKKKSTKNILIKFYIFLKKNVLNMF